MTQKTGRCKNYGACGNADSRKLLQADDTHFVCPNPECGKPLVEVAGSAGGGSKNTGKYWRIGGGVSVLVVMMALGYLGFSPGQGEAPEIPPPTLVPPSQPGEDQKRSSPNGIPGTSREWVDFFHIDR